MTALRVLVVEDEAVIAMLLAEVLEGMGHEVCAIASTQTDAIAAAAQHKPDLMIVDARLREGSGVSAVAEILLCGFVPHLFVSGDARINEILERGTPVLEKPFQESDLVRAIQDALAAPLALAVR